ncbi:cob(I)yrinic acid a,c-diamide adenosyltransferase [Reinekea marinisedimentorum]|uniref:Corrinoid adenosyltransferase n=1 Tax=Reinekea marinisedimentorum TaxID=230495 RepID=A0A4R3I7G1_9GAMM|nr:cob(I)yrinic acid a,c-diamide adenosyltransferase [Reinekea marinisedimentorum]TCS42086.1 cob(I)alamin adenosyltransferase [Reinekea marinisedimentorum]
MGIRLTKIYTRSGDKGKTGLGIKDRIAKDSLRITAIGDIDELNSTVGVLIETLDKSSELIKPLRQRQHDLFDLGGELAMPGYELLGSELITDLETEIDQLNEALPPLENFILPGGNLAAAQTHMARSICRRAERTVVSFNREEEKPHLLAQQYLNRLSDYFFVLARHLARQSDGEEILWQSRHKR